MALGLHTELKWSWGADEIRDWVVQALIKHILYHLIIMKELNMLFNSSGHVLFFLFFVFLSNR